MVNGLEKSRPNQAVVRQRWPERDARPQGRPAGRSETATVRRLSAAARVSGCSSGHVTACANRRRNEADQLSRTRARRRSHGWSALVARLARDLCRVLLAHRFARGCARAHRCRTGICRICSRAVLVARLAGNSPARVLRARNRHLPGSAGSAGLRHGGRCHGGERQHRGSEPQHAKPNRVGAPARKRYSNPNSISRACSSDKT